jgi:threonylcarbamoyladenosine tRNA methylthiotransferase MtaB
MKPPAYAPVPAPPSVRIDTLGCRVNKYDAALLRGDLAARGFDVVPEGDEAAPFDVYVLNSCTVTAQADREVERRVRQARRRRPDSLVVLAGCYPTAQPDRAAALAEVDWTISTPDKPRLGERLDAALAPRRGPDPGQSPVDQGQHTRLFLKVQEGCDVQCTFCIVPHARGPATSRPPDELVAMAASASARGVREVVVAGIHLGGYGRDELSSWPHATSATRRQGLATLLQRLLRETELPRLRLGSLEPWGVRPELVELYRREPRLMPSMHLPLQSGSERILRAMRRPITAERYLATVERLLDARPELALTLDVLVGFPGETEEDFEATCGLLARFPWVKLHVFPYSPRPDTPAAALPDDVPRELKRARARRLIDWSDERLLYHLRSKVGHTDQVLMERGGQGKLRDGTAVHVDPQPAGTLLQVRIQELCLDDSGAPRLVGTPAIPPVPRG